MNYFLMTRICLIILFVLSLASVAYAACRTYTIYLPDGNVQICTECCWSGGQCTVTCY